MDSNLKNPLNEKEDSDFEGLFIATDVFIFLYPDGFSNFVVFSFDTIFYIYINILFFKYLLNI